MWLQDVHTEHGDSVRILTDAGRRPLVESILSAYHGGRQRLPTAPEIVLIVAARPSVELCALAETALHAATLGLFCCCTDEPGDPPDPADRDWMQTWIDAWFIGADTLAPVLGLLLEAACAGIGMRRADSLLRALGGVGGCAIRSHAVAASDVRRHRVRRLPMIDHEILDAPNLIALVRGSVRRIDAVNAIHCALLCARRAGDLYLCCRVLPRRQHGFVLDLITPAPSPDDTPADAARVLAIERLLSRFPERQLGPLRRFARLPGAADLLIASPALALALACWPSFRTCPPPGTKTPADLSGCARLTGSGRALIVARLRAPQRELLAWLGFPGSDSARRYLARLAPECIDLELLLALRDCLRVPERFAKLRHARPGTRQELCLLLEPEILDRFSIGLLQQLSRCPPEALPGSWYQAGKLLLRRGNHNAPREFASHDALIAWAVQQTGARLLRAPPPDHPGAQRIRSATGLLAEASAMQHCLGNAKYALLLDEGSALFYRVLKPVRATLMYQRQGALWVLAEIKGRKGRSLRPGEVANCLQVMAGEH